MAVGEQRAQGCAAVDQRPIAVGMATPTEGMNGLGSCAGAVTVQRLRAQAVVIQEALLCKASDHVTPGKANAGVAETPDGAPPVEAAFFDTVFYDDLSSHQGEGWLWLETNHVDTDVCLISPHNC